MLCCKAVYGGRLWRPVLNLEFARLVQQSLGSSALFLSYVFVDIYTLGRQPIVAATVRRVRPQLYSGPSCFRNINGDFIFNINIIIPASMFLPVRLLRPREAVRTTKQDKHSLGPGGTRAP
jgi:uncharacterized membrane protein